MPQSLLEIVQSFQFQINQYCDELAKEFQKVDESTASIQKHLEEKEKTLEYEVSMFSKLKQKFSEQVQAFLSVLGPVFTQEIPQSSLTPSSPFSQPTVDGEDGEEESGDEKSKDEDDEEEEEGEEGSNDEEGDKDEQQSYSDE
ncbi:hypothetical protein ADUPG1_013584 [Aduncisulcus paluster]|uniref:Uncharacterized protein n=1 Tax=Aduncisulcus paluster TaxID=2918883 RepID=A0ABQ5K722_9EUKA|nr:hypothetical protein ADUPG1_013584 [Aduncisulcus paluster]|eukprot:gnl/Carplike_NY0171/14547_a21534_98.p1 GENE.gnl/Carplike_NY0171/14547_a21534_98~~gnl/Carplike_NY0171/14547_a21534_98.p1  ORF type:complete len:143 (-),score=55.01 gnl/Carplike_NY0171/14547_a21534_98:133-561(-)